MLAISHPKFSFDSEGRLHSENGPAMEWEDETGVYYRRGVQVPGWFIRRPERLTASRAFNERNTERRRVMIERLGLERVIRELNGALIHENPGGRLWRISRPPHHPVAAVEVRCPSTGRVYFLRVPPHMRRVNQAVAWTFGLRPGEYRPIQES